jgi:hypothetical protein
VRHVEGIIMKDVRLRIAAPDYRPAFVFDDVRDLMMKGIKVHGERNQSDIILYNTENVDIEYDQPAVYLKKP